jgi:hypothetical protein
MSSQIPNELPMLYTQQDPVIDLDKQIPNIPKLPEQLDLDKQIPNYAQQISNRLLSDAEYLSNDVNDSVNNIKQVAGNFLTNKWNEAKSMMQSWSIGTQSSQSGGRKKRTKKSKIKIQKSKKRNRDKKSKAKRNK